MQKSKNFYFVPCYFLLVLGLFSCSSLADVGGNGTNIRDIKQDPQVHSSVAAPKTVKLKGKVVTIARFIGKGAYELQDPTDSIWVISKEPLPNSGDELLIKGLTHYQSIPIGGNELGEVYIEEQEQVKESVNKP